MISSVLDIIRLYKHRSGMHNQQLHNPHNDSSVGFGEAYDRVGTSATYMDEGPTGWEAGSGDITRVDEHVLVPVDLLRSSRADVVRHAGVQSTRSFEYRRKLQDTIKSEGLKEGITVGVEKNGDITIIDGTHRLEAVDNLGWENIPAEVRYFGNSQRDGLISVGVHE